MTEEAKLIVAALRTSCEENGSCPDCPVNYWCHAKNGVRIEDDAADLIESLSEQLEQTENKLSELLYYVTGGRFSKTDYSTDDMRRFVDDYNQSTCDECDKCDELEQVTRERDAAFRHIKRGCRACSACRYGDDTPENNEVCDKCIPNPEGYSEWQWEGVEVTNDAQKGSYAES